MDYEITIKIDSRDSHEGVARVIVENAIEFAKKIETNLLLTEDGDRVTVTCLPAIEVDSLPQTVYRSEQN